MSELLIEKLQRTSNPPRVSNLCKLVCACGGRRTLTLRKGGFFFFFLGISFFFYIQHAYLARLSCNVDEVNDLCDACTSLNVIFLSLHLSNT